MAQQNLPIISAQDPLGGLRGFFQNLTQAALQQQQQQRAGRQLGQLFPNLNLQGMTSPLALNVAANLGIAQATRAPISPTQQIAQEKLNLIRRLQAIPPGQRTQEQQASLKRMLEGQAAVQVFTGDIEKGTKGKIEQDIIELQGTLTELEAIEKQFDEDFFTFRGKGKAFFVDLAAQLEIPVTQAQRDFLIRKTKFFADSKRVFLKFRKFITGVAGGIEEFREIAKATIDPEKGSGIAFQAKFESMRDNAIRTQNVLLAIRNSGLDPSNKAIQRQVFKGMSLKNIPLDVPGTVTLETLSTQQPDKLIISPFGTEDVPTAVSPRTGETLIFKNGRWQPKPK